MVLSLTGISRILGRHFAAHASSTKQLTKSNQSSLCDTKRDLRSHGVSELISRVFLDTPSWGYVGPSDYKPSLRRRAQCMIHDVRCIDAISLYLIIYH